jgi:hypothetical protein
MGCDMLVALGPATTHGHTLLGFNGFAPATEQIRLRACSGQLHSADETLSLGNVSLPQVRQTSAVLGLQHPSAWGLLGGVNEHHVAVGMTRWRSRLPKERPGLSGADLVRLALERSHSAPQAVEVLTDLVTRLGLGATGGPTDEASDAVFLVADRNEAYVLEAAGTFWALIECQHVRAVADAALIRQDWLRLAPGLAEHVLQHRWWPDNGTKLDFAGTLCLARGAPPAGLRRWGKATLLLAQNNGTLDVCKMRDLLPQHFAACEAHRRRPAGSPEQLAASWVTQLEGEGPAIVWYGVGAGEPQVYFPLIVDAELPGEWIEASLPVPRRMTAHDYQRFQTQFDQDVEEYLAEARQLQQQGNQALVRRLAQVLMQKHVEQWQRECYQAPTAHRGPHRPPEARARADDEAVTYAFG